MKPEDEPWHDYFLLQADDIAHYFKQLGLTRWKFKALSNAKATALSSLNESSPPVSTSYYKKKKESRISDFV